MLLIFTTFLLVLASLSLAVLLKKIFSPKLLEENPPHVIAAENYRPLFAPTDNDLREFEAEEKARVAANQANEERLLSEETLVNLEEFRQNWLETKDKGATAELLYRASQTANGEVYLETAGIVLEAWHAGDIPGLTADDLAHLLDSHLWLLPVHERTPGVSFRLQQEIAGLRREPQKK